MAFINNSPIAGNFCSYAVKKKLEYLKYDYVGIKEGKGFV